MSVKKAKQTRKLTIYFQKGVSSRFSSSSYYTIVQIFIFPKTLFSSPPNTPIRFRSRSDYHDPQKPQCSYNDTKYFLHELLLSLFALAQPEEGQLVNSQYGLPHAQRGSVRQVPRESRRPLHSHGSSRDGDKQSTSEHVLEAERAYC